MGASLNLRLGPNLSLSLRLSLLTSLVSGFLKSNPTTLKLLLTLSL